MNESRIAFVGAGPTNIAAIKKLVERLSHSPHVVKALKIELEVYDIRLDNFWGGDAFKRSTPEMLFNDDIEELLRREYGEFGNLISQFNNWINVYRDKWVDKIKESKDPAVSKWLDEYKVQIEQRQFYQIKLPRMVLGMFLEDVFARTIIQAEELADAMGVTITPIVGEVVEITKMPDGKSKCSFNKPAVVYNTKVHDITPPKTEIPYNDPKRAKEYKVEYIQTDRIVNEVVADDVVFCPGFDRRTKLPQLEGLENYYPNHLDITTSLRSFILSEYKRTGKTVEIACLGSGAAFMDTVTHLDVPEIADKVHITCYSLHGNTPIAFRKEEEAAAKDSGYERRFITNDKTFGNVDEMRSALESEIENAKFFGLTRASAYYALVDWYEANKGKELNDDVRREVESIIKNLKFTSLYSARCRENLKITEAKGMINTDEITHSNRAIKIGSTEHSALVNCSGFGTIRNHPIVSKLVESKELGISVSGMRGINVNSSLEARPGLYIAGSVAAARCVNGVEKNHIPNVNQYFRDGGVIAEDLMRKLTDRAARTNGAGLHA